MTRENKVSEILKVIGYINIAIGVICAFSFGIDNNSYPSEILWTDLFTWLAIGFIAGMIFIGFAEVIKQLHMINYRAFKEKEGISGEPSKSDMENKDEVPPLEYQVPESVSEAEKDKIYSLYGKKKIAEIIPTPVEDTYIVKFDGDHEDAVVNCSGFSALETYDSKVHAKINEWLNKKEK